MSDLISRQAAIDAICNDMCGGRSGCKFYIHCDNLTSIKALPSAQPKRGKWLPDNNNYIYEQYVCSECKNSFKVDTCMGKPQWNFCPNCGADMRGEQDG